VLQLDNSNNELEMVEAITEELEELTEDQVEEVRKEFLFTATLTLAVLVAFTALLACQWIQSRRNYSDRKVDKQLISCIQSDQDFT